MVRQSSAGRLGSMQAKGFSLFWIFWGGVDLFKRSRPFVIAISVLLSPDAYASVIKTLEAKGLQPSMFMTQIASSLLTRPCILPYNESSVIYGRGNWSHPHPPAGPAHSWNSLWRRYTKNLPRTIVTQLKMSNIPLAKYLFHIGKSTTSTCQTRKAFSTTSYNAQPIQPCTKPHPRMIVTSPYCPAFRLRNLTYCPSAAR